MLNRSLRQRVKMRLSNWKGDTWILFLTFALAGLGVLAIYSASSYVAQTQYNDKWYFVNGGRSNVEKQI